MSPVLQGLLGSLSKVPLQKETEAWLARTSPRPSSSRTFAVNKLITAGKREGWLNRLDAMWITNGQTQQNANLNIISALYPLTPINAPTWTAGLGYLFDGATNYCNTDIDLTTFGGKYTRYDCSMFAFTLNEAPGLYNVMGSTSAGARATLRTLNGVSSSINSNATTSDSFRVTQGRGLLGFSRLSDASYTFFKSGVATRFTRPTTGVPSGPFRLGRLGSGNTYSKDLVGFACLGAGLTDAMIASLYDAVVNYFIDTNSIDDDNPDPPEIYGSGCFFQSEVPSITPAGLQVIQQAPPAADMTYNGSTYVFFPETCAASQAIDQTIASTRTDIKAEHFIWGYREKKTNNSNTAFPNPRPNLIYPTTPFPGSGAECRLFYSTRSKARAAWIVAQRYSAGALPRSDVRYPDGRGWLDVADAAGYDTSGWAGKTGIDLTTNANVNTSGGLTTNIVLHHAYMAAAAATVFAGSFGTYRTATDVIYLPVGRAVDSTSIIVESFLRDTEDGTNITPAELLSTVQEAAASCHATGHKLTVYINPANGAGAIASGVSATNGYALQQACDHISIVAWPKNIERNMRASLDNQWAIFTGPSGEQPDPLKIELVVGIGGRGQEMTTVDAMTVRAFLLEKGIMRVNFWRYYGVAGGDRSRQYNQVIAIILGLSRTVTPTS